MDLDCTLQRLCEILDSHSGDHAAWLRKTTALRTTAPVDFYTALNSKRMWGGAGAIANEALADNPGIKPAVWEMEIREFRGLMIDLAEHLKQRGDAYPDIDFWLTAFSNWQQSGI